MTIRTPDVYVDPVLGDAGNSGASELLPLDDIAATMLTNTTYGLKRGTVLDISGRTAGLEFENANTALVSYGSGARAICDSGRGSPYANIVIVTEVDAYIEGIHFRGNCNDTLACIEVQNDRFSMVDFEVEPYNTGGVLANGSTGSTGADYFLLRDGTIKVSTDGKRGFYALSVATGLKLESVTAICDMVSPGTNNQGFYLAGPTGKAVLTGCVAQNWYTGFQVEDTNNHELLDCQALECTNEGFILESADSCLLLRPVVKAEVNKTLRAIDLTETTQDARVLDIDISYVDQGIRDASTGGGNWFIGGKMRNYDTNGISITGNNSNADIIIAHMSIEHDIAQGDSGHGIVLQSGANLNAVIVNNLIVNKRRGDTNSQCIAISGGGTARAIHIDYNHYWTENGAWIGALDTVNFTSLEAWRVALNADSDITGNDDNSVHADPGITSFEDPTPSNPSEKCYLLPLGSIALPAGYSFTSYANPAKQKGWIQ